jgi:hypothetical protein
MRVDNVTSRDSMDNLRQWAEEHHTLFDALSSTLTAATEQAARIGVALQNGHSTTTALAILNRAASHLLSLVHDAQEYPAIPDADTNLHFSTALALWESAAGSLVQLCSELDAAGVVRVASELDAGTEEFFRAGAALRRATGQPPDPTNPFS